MSALEVTTRNEIGTRRARALRAKGLVPAVIYGHGKATVSVVLHQVDLDTAVHRRQRLLELSLDGEIENVLIKDLQWDTFGTDILHVDLTRVDMDELVRVLVPITLHGTPAGLKDGGVLQQATAYVNIECTVRSIPGEISVMTAQMNIGDSLLLSDLELPEGAKLLDNGETRVCTVSMMAEEEEEPTDEEGGDQPEIIGETPEEETESKE